ncbi:MAG: class I SAM-dependent methyltransferase [Acidimicrobiia bacterium]|nr:class I SAM-dependent methyltransferase [Acidimicrobiia bacterium]
MTEWDDLAAWWLSEVEDDAAYRDDVLPLALELFTAPTGPVLDIGCGEGRVMRELDDRTVVGCDGSWELLRVAAAGGRPVVRTELPELAWVRSASCAGSIAVMVLEHVAALDTLMAEAARVTMPGGTLVAVMNHPAYTAPRSGPIVDQSDGEILWRWGPYFAEVESHEPAGAGTVTFHHRPMGRILNAAASAGWNLEQLEERPLSPATIVRHPGLIGQEQFPRLLGIRWRRPAS